MDLAVFDIDGTLTRTMGLCDAPFAAAVRSVLGIEIDMDWSHYPDVTDSGITWSAFQRALGRGPTETELEEVKRRYGASLDGAGAGAEPMPGARTVLRRLSAQPGWAATLATGNWAHAALRKLDGCGIEREGIPMATADDALRRAEILEIAITRAGVRPSGVVYVGDAEWDRAAARALGVGFLGVGSRVGDLLDFSDFDALLDALKGAARE